MNKISVVIITEQGRLEAESKMLISSIRTFGGQFKDVPIYSYQPRKGYRISKQTMDFFEQNQVHYIDLALNVKYTDYPLANKIYTTAHAEEHLDSEIIVFMDSDKVVWQEPKEFYEKSDFDVALTPVFRKLSWAVVEMDENYKYWNRMFELFNIHEKKYIKTIVDNQDVLAYYNSGLQVVKRATGLFQSAKTNFEKLMDLDQPFFTHRFVEQANFSATALSLNLNIKALGKGYNYPLKHHGRVQNPNYALNSLAEVITGHYTTLFKKAGYKNPLKGKIIEGEKGQWFKQKALEYGIYTPWYKKLF